MPKTVRKEANQIRHKPRLEVLIDQVLGLSLLTGNQEYLKDLGLQLPEENDKKELLQFAAEMDIKEQQLDAKQELERVASELRRLITKQKMMALAEQIKIAEQEKNQRLMEELSKEYVMLGKQISN